jgi:hypothetical protein
MISYQEQVLDLLKADIEFEKYSLKEEKETINNFE